MAINYNAGFLPQQLYQNMFDAQRAGLEERNRRQREQYQNLGSVIGRLAKYNVDQGNQQLKDFEERYKTQRDQLVNLRNTADPRTDDYKNVQGQINLLDQDYANMKQGFNQTGFLNMGRDESVLDLPDRTGTYAKKLINPRTGVPFIGGPGAAFDDEPIGYFQPASVSPESTKEAYALKDKQAEMRFLTDALKQRGIDTAQTNLDFVGKLQNAKTKAEIDSLFQTLGNEDLQKLIRTVEGEAQLNKGKIANEIFGDQTSYVIERLRQKLGEENIAQLDLLRDSIEPKLELAQGQADIQDESYGKRAGIDTTEQKQRGQDAADIDVNKYDRLTPGFINRFQQQEGVTTKALQQRGQDAADIDVNKYDRLTPLVVKRSNQIGDDEQRRKIDYLRESMGLDTDKAIALANLQSELKKKELAYADKLKDLTPEEKEAKRIQRWQDGFKDFLDKLIPDGASDLETQNAFKLAREMADETYGPRAGTVPIPNYDDLRSGSNAENPPAAGGSGFIPKGGPTLSEGEIVEALELAEAFPNNEESRKVQQYASQYNTLLTRLFAETDPVKKQELQGQFQQLQAEAAPVLKDFRKDTIKDQATLKQLAKQDVRNTDNPPEDKGFLEKIGLTTPMDETAKKVSEGTTTVKRQNAKTEAQAFAELTPEEQDAYNKRLEMADERMRSIGTMINSFRQFDRVAYGRGIRDNYVALRDALSKISDGFTKGEFKATDLANPKSKLTKIYLEDIIPNYNILKNRIDDLRRNEEEMANQAKIQ